MVVSIDGWSLYGGALVQLKWTMNQPTVVSIDGWSLYGGDLVQLKWTMSPQWSQQTSGLYNYASGLQDKFCCTVKPI